jgi:hypothetical protein
MNNEYPEVFDNYEVSLLETLDHVLNRGLVISGDITISVADIDLIYLGLNVILASVDTINRALSNREDQGPVVADNRSGQSNLEDSDRSRM